jgi:hypothetical protein
VLFELPFLGLSLDGTLVTDGYEELFRVQPPKTPMNAEKPFGVCAL